MGTDSKESKQTVLVVDDTLSSRLVTSEIMKSEDVEVVTCGSGKEALEYIDVHQEVSLILIDIVMPEMDGYELASRIHDKPICKYVPIIFITGTQLNQDQLVKSYQYGVVDVLYKPLHPYILQSKARILLELDAQRRLIKEQSAELQNALERVQHYAQHDQLTKLFNREQITNILIRLMADSRRSKKLIAVLFLDLDHFKNVNDSLGHDVGDILLKNAAERIKGVVREGDFVARLGGDEFAIILNGLSSHSAAADVAQKMLDKIVLPYFISEHEIMVSGSIGISLYNNVSRSAADLLKSADSAMYLAKRKGRNQYAYFSEELEKEALSKIDIAQKLNEAIENDELSICYQPQVSASGHKLIGFEALLRWQSESKFISPSIFIPIAEESGLIPKLGEWVLLHSCLDLKRWQEEGLVDKHVKVSVNISNRQIQASNFLKVLDKVLTRSAISPKCLELELTESTVMDDPNSTISTFNEIHKLGIEIAVDDFGTGYSSLNYLSQLPLDTLKIDQSFVKHISIDKNDEAIVKAIISLSRNLGLKVVAEGVETDVQKDFLKKNHCHTLQGYLFSKPIPSGDMENYLSQPQSSVARQGLN